MYGSQTVKTSEYSEFLKTAALKTNSYEEILTVIVFP